MIARIHVWCSLDWLVVQLVVLFFSSRRRHTRYWRDWSSDVCSSDLAVRAMGSRFAALEDALADDHRRGFARYGSDFGIGRAWCRGRVVVSVVAVSLKKKKKNLCE